MKERRKILFKTLLISLFMFIFNINSVKAAEGVLLKDANKVYGDKFESVSLGTTADSEYSFSFKVTNDTRLEWWGNVGKVLEKGTAKYIYPTDNSLSGKIGCYLYNVGMYNGKVINVKCTFDWESITTANGTKIYPVIAPNLAIGTQVLGFNFTTNGYGVKYELLDENMEPLYVSMSASIGDIDSRQYFGFKLFNGTINKVQCTKDSIVYYQNLNGYDWFYADNTVSENGLESVARLELKNVNSFYVWYGNEGDKYSKSFFKGFRPDRADSSLINRNNEIANAFKTGDTSVLSGGWGFFNGQAFGPYEVSTPIKNITDSDEKEVISNTITKDEVFFYDIYQYVPLESENYYYSKFTMTDTLADNIIYMSSRIYDNAGNDVTNKFTITANGKNLTAVANSTNKSDFYSNTYKWRINAKLDKDILQTDKTSGSNWSYDKTNHRYIINNVAKVSVVRNGVTTEKSTNNTTTNYNKLPAQVEVRHRDYYSKADIIEPEIINGFEYENYTTSQKDFSNAYTFETVEGQVSGKMTPEKIIVTYYYKKNTSVEVRYIDQVTGKEIADTVTKTGLERDPYETEAKDVEGYELVLTPSNAKGEMTVEKITVTYEYRKLSDVTVKYVDENTGEEIEGADQVVTTYKQGESYTTEKKQIAGYTYTRDTQNTAGTVEDKDIEVVYYYKKNTSVTVRYLDVKTNESLEKEIVINGLEADDYDTEQKTFEGYKYVSVDGNTSGKMEREPITITYYYIKQSNVVTKYVDKVTGEEITDKIEVTYSEGDNYTTVRKTIEGYTCVEDSKNITGVVGRENIEVTYYYKKNTGVTVKYIDMYENIEISGTESKTGLEGDEYTTEQKDIPGYRFVEVVGEPSGQMSREPVEIVYKYVKQTKVTVYHKDENTNEILIAEMPVDYDEKAEYTTKEKEIKGYTKTGDSGNTAGVVGRENIEVTYYYKKNTKVTVKYIDMVTGEKIGEEEVIEGLERDEYETVKKEIEGYEWVETEGKASGQMEKNPTEVIYKYKKVSKLITEHIDANTNEKIIENIEKEYKEGERYEALAQNLEGYVLVESPEETTGVMGRENITKTFYYKKISAGLTVKYVDKITGELLDQKEYSGNEKDVIELEEKDFKYYILSSKPDFSQVELTVEPQEVVYYYIRTSKVEIEGIDQESGEVLYQGEVSGLEGDKYETYPREIEGYELVKIPDNQNGTYKRNNEKVVYEYRKIAGKVEVKYVDDETGEIIESYEIEGKVGDSYKTERREYEGYSLVKVEGETSGVLEREEKEVIYHYERKIGKLIVKYIDEEGKEILREESEGKVGDKYKVEEKEIEGYEIVKRPENVEGEYKEGVIEVVFIVRQEVVVEPIEKGTIKVNFIDKEGNILKETYIEEGEEGKEFYMEAPEIEGYKIVGEREIRATFVAGEIVFDIVYEKIPEEINVDTGDIAVIAIASVTVICVIGIVIVIVRNKKKNK